MGWAMYGCVIWSGGLKSTGGASRCNHAEIVLDGCPSVSSFLASHIYPCVGNRLVNNNNNIDANKTTTTTTNNNNNSNSDTKSLPNQTTQVNLKHPLPSSVSEAEAITDDVLVSAALEMFGGDGGDGERSNGGAQPVRVIAAGSRVAGVIKSPSNHLVSRK